MLDVGIDLERRKKIQCTTAERGARSDCGVSRRHGLLHRNCGAGARRPDARRIKIRGPILLLPRSLWWNRYQHPLMALRLLLARL